MMFVKEGVSFPIGYDDAGYGVLATPPDGTRHGFEERR